MIETRAPTAHAIIVNYYRTCGRWRKLTLAKFLRQIGQSHRESYIRKVKVIYDKKHKRTPLLR